MNYIKNSPRAKLQAAQRKSKFAIPEGYIPSEHIKDSVRRKLKEHPTNSIHRDAISWMKDKYKSILEQQVTQFKHASNMQRTKRNEITAQVITTVYAEVKANIPFSAHETIITLQQRNGLNMGTHHQSQKGAAAMTASISLTMHKSLLSFMQKFKSLPVAIVLDSTSDVHSNSYLMIYFRMLERSKPKMFFYRFERLMQVETGRSLLDKLKEIFTKDKLLTIISERLWGVTTDGASVMTGNQAGLISLLRPMAKNNFFQHHCAAHKLELTLHHAFESFPYMKQLDSHIN